MLLLMYTCSANQLLHQQLMPWTDAQPLQQPAEVQHSFIRNVVYVLYNECTPIIVSCLLEHCLSDKHQGRTHGGVTALCTAQHYVR